MFVHAPFAKAMRAAGAPSFGEAETMPFTYQDYLYELLCDGSSERPVTEQQWEMICDIIGNRRMMYASNSASAIRLIEKKAT